MREFVGRATVVDNPAMALPSTNVTYDEVPYDGGLMDGIHPNTFAVIGRLFGMTPAAVQTCSVLEIGCASGGNLVPMAYSLPHARFVGLDPAARQIDIARERANELGIRNIGLETADIRDYMDRGQTFDYIICHGVFSWVEDSVREAILEACRRMLNPQGVGYISYNTLPGFYARAPVRDAMRFHASYFAETEDRIGQARAFMHFLQEATAHFREAGGTMGPAHALIDYEARLLGGAPDSYLAHEHLADDNQAFYFHEFAAMLPGHGLQYLGDTQFETMVTLSLPPEVAQAIDRIASTQLLAEQYRDMVVNRSFRRSLVCHAEVPLGRTVDGGDVANYRFRLTRTREPGAAWTISRPGRGEATPSDPGMIAVMDYLESQSPLCPAFGDILAALPERFSDDANRLAGILMTLLAHSAIDFRTYAPEVAPVIEERPLAYLPARMAAEAGRTWVPTPFHASLGFDPVTLAILREADGTREQERIIDGLRARLRAGEFGDEAEATDEDLERLVNEGLEHLRYQGLLVPSGGGELP